MRRIGNGKNLAGRKMAVAGLALTAVLCLCACASGAGGVEEETQVQEAAGGKALGDFTSETLTGEAVTQEILEGSQLTMVNIWGTFCGPCISEMPALGELNREYADRGFRVVGIVSDVTAAGDETAQEIVEQTGADYTHIVASEDLRSGILRIVNAVPTTIFIDSEGKRVGEVCMGSRSKEEWAKLIESKLAELEEIQE